MGIDYEQSKENSDSESETEGKEDEPQTDMQMGDADEPQEEQLDPKLWDEEDKPEEPNDNQLDDKADGAQETTEDLTARDQNKSDQKMPEQTEDLPNPEDEADTNADAQKDDDKMADDEDNVDDQLDMENIDLNDAVEEEDDEQDENKGQEAPDEFRPDDQQPEEEVDKETEENSAEPPQPETVDSADKQTPDAQVQESVATQGDAASSAEDRVQPDDAAQPDAKDNNNDEAKPDENDVDKEKDAAEQEQNSEPTNREQKNAQQRGAEKRPENQPSNLEKPPNKKSRLAQHEKSEDRSLAERRDQQAENRAQQQRTDEDDDASTQNQNNPDQIADEYRHEPDLSAAQRHMQVIDSATLDEALKQQQMEIQAEQENPEEEAVETMDTNDELSEDKKEEPGKVHESADQKPQQQIVTKQDDPMAEASSANPTLDDLTEPRDRSSTIHTNADFYVHVTEQLADSGSLLDEILDQHPASSIDEGMDPEVARDIWQACQSKTQSLAAELTENLRLILEPTKASQLEGNYRTGKRLNMRKLITYVASHFRKNKIWLRRTRQAQRDYQILIAVDDSSSMSDNRTKMLAYESLSLLESALRRLEVGQLGVCKFGADVQLLHRIAEPLTDQTSVQLVQQLDFQQSGTNVIKLLDFCTSYFHTLGATSSSSGSVPSQLLLILSDGRGIFTEGIEKARQAAQRTLATGVFIVFIIVDNPDAPDSILDIRIPQFHADGRPPTFHSYMDYFPFPFYMILRQIDALPAIVGEALRQWFEMVAGDK